MKYRQSAEIEIRSKSDPLPHIPAGEYEVVCIKDEVKRYLKDERRLYLHFQIIEGEYLGLNLFGTYNFKYKSFPRGSKYYADWSIANGALPKRSDRMTPRVFQDKNFLVKVRDAAPAYQDGTPKPEMFTYSVVDRIIAKVTG